MASVPRRQSPADLDEAIELAEGAIGQVRKMRPKLSTIAHQREIERLQVNLNVLLGCITELLAAADREARDRRKGVYVKK